MKHLDDSKKYDAEDYLKKILYLVKERKKKKEESESN